MSKVYIKYNSTRGLSTKVWGPKLWDSLFSMIIGGYPVKIIPNNKEHAKIKRAYVSTMCNLQYTLPCSFCRASFKEYYNQVPINKYTGTRIEMMYWLYLIKDLVNKKLIHQEREYLRKQKDDYESKKISKKIYTSNKKMCFKTKPSPEFVEVLDKYEALRASCHKKLKRCV